MQQPGQHVTDRSDMGLGAQFGPVSGRGGVYISFQWVMIRMETVDPEKNGKSERRLRLMKQPVGDTSTAAMSYITEEEAARLYPAEWEYFTKHGDMPMSGTALSELPGISMSQIGIMQMSGLRSIEDVLAINEEVISSIGHEGRFVRSVAQEWAKKRDENAEVTDFAEAKASFSAALNAQKSRAERAEAEAVQLQSRIAALEAVVGGNPNVQQAGLGNAGMEPVSPGALQAQDPSIDDAPNPLDDSTGGEFDPLSE